MNGIASERWLCWPRAASSGFVRTSADEDDIPAQNAVQIKVTGLGLSEPKVGLGAVPEVQRSPFSTLRMPESGGGGSSGFGCAFDPTASSAGKVNTTDRHRVGRQPKNPDYK
jgi:hypothetical protein